MGDARYLLSASQGALPLCMLSFSAFTSFGKLGLLRPDHFRYLRETHLSSGTLVPNSRKNTFGWSIHCPCDQDNGCGDTGTMGRDDCSGFVWRNVLDRILGVQLEPSRAPEVVLKLLWKNQGIGFPYPVARVGHRGFSHQDDGKLGIMWHQSVQMTKLINARVNKIFLWVETEMINLWSEAAHGIQKPEAEVRGLLEFLGYAGWSMLDFHPLWN